MYASTLRIRLARRRSCIVRVIGGSLRGRRLRGVRGRSVRPTSDRVREAIFNVLAKVIVDARVLDLYAGTGAMTIEALSRGAASAVCVDASRRALAVIERNVAELDLDERVTVVRSDALDYSRRIVEDGAIFEVVFCDPPYASEFEPIADAVVAATWWSTVCVVEHPATLEPADVSALDRDTRVYGDTAVTFFWRS